MLHRPFDPAALRASFASDNYDSYDEWAVEARRATRRLISWFKRNPPGGEKPTAENRVYGGLKKALTAYFIGKCAYCDSSFEEIAWGDVDHYRPKFRVNGNPAHRGYYWLAYCPTNLLPACDKCNRGGKRDYFPVDPLNTNALRPKLVTRELPLLLSPYDDRLRKIKEHFNYTFVEENDDLKPTGEVEGISDAAKRSIEIYDLNRPPLKKRRRDAQETAIDKLKAGLLETRTLEQAIDKLFDAARPYAMAIQFTCEAYFAYLEERNRRVIQRRRPGG